MLQIEFKRFSSTLNTISESENLSTRVNLLKNCSDRSRLSQSLQTKLL